MSDLIWGDTVYYVGDGPLHGRKLFVVGENNEGDDIFQADDGQPLRFNGSDRHVLDIPDNLVAREMPPAEPAPEEPCCDECGALAVIRILREAPILLQSERDPCILITKDILHRLRAVDDEEPDDDDAAIEF